MELVIKTQGKKLEALMAVLKALDISFEAKTKQDTSPYSPAFVAKIEKAKESYRNGEYITIKDTKNIWESILSE
jgi:hypothetical protein